MAKEVETRTVVNRVREADGTITEIRVVEKRLKKQHDSMMRHMLRQKEKAEAAAAAQPSPAVEQTLEPADVPEAVTDEP